MQKIVKMTTLITHFDYIETYRSVRDEFFEEPCRPQYAAYRGKFGFAGFYGRD